MRLPLLTLVASTLLAASAHAQQDAAGGAPAVVRVAPPATRDDTVRAFKAMAASLRDLVLAQEAYYAKHGSYTTAAGALGIWRGEGARAQVIFAGGRGWTAMATVRGLQGRSCVMFAGNVDEIPKLPTTLADRRTPVQAQEGQPVCDTP
jgi:hypothetical protein